MVNKKSILKKEMKLNIDLKKLKTLYNRFINGNDRLLVLEVGTATTKIIEYEVTPKGIEVLDGFIEKTPEGAIDDSGIINHKILYEMLSKQIQEKKFTTKELVVSIVSKEVITRDMNIPDMEEYNLQNLVIINSSDIFPVKLKDYLLSYSLMKAKGAKAENRLKIGAIPKEIVLPYIALADNLRLHLVGVNYSGYELYNFIDYELEEEKGDYAIIVIGARYTDLAVISRGILKFNRTIGRGSGEVNEKIREEMHCSLTKAEELKRKYNSIIIEGSLDSESEVYKVANIMRDVLDDIMKEIVRVIDFYNSNNMTDKIQKVFVTGLGSRISGLQEYFENKLDIPTVKIRNFNKVFFSNKAKHLKGRKFTLINCFGAHDLKKREYHLIKGGLRLSNMSVLKDTRFYKTLACFVALMVILGTFFYLKTSSIENKIADYTNYIDSKLEIKKLQSRIVQQTQEKRTYDNIIKKMGSETDSRLEYLQYIENSIAKFGEFADISITSYKILGNIIDISCVASLKNSNLSQMSPDYLRYKNIAFDLKDELSEHFEIMSYTQISKGGSFTYSLKIKQGAEVEK